jgi:hypothetical protein
MVFIGNDTFDLAVALIGSETASAAGPLAGAVLRLTQVEVNPARNTTLAALNADTCTFTGYGDETITWQLPSIADDGNVEVLSNPITYRPSDSAAPNNVYDAYIVNAAKSAWYLAGTVDGAPVPMEDALHTLTITVRWRPSTGGYGVCVS